MQEAGQEAEQDAGAVHCEHGERCGGCTLLGVTRPEQHRQKRESVRAAFGRYPALASLPIAELGAAQPSLAYRVRAKLVVDGAGRIGLYARGSHDVVDIPHCRVLAPGIARVVAELRARLAGKKPLLSGIDVRNIQSPDASGVLLTLNGSADRQAEIEALARDFAAIEGVLGVAVSTRDAQSPAFLGELPVRVAGADAVRDRLLPDGPYHLSTYGSFVQAHAGQAAAIATRVIDGLRSALGSLQDARVLELYAGSGALGLQLAQAGARPLLVEQFAPALALAARAAQEQQLDALRVHNDDAARSVRELAGAGERFDAAIVNPPRRGLPPEVRSALHTLAPRVIAYVSCDAETLARDLDHLARLGYAAHAIEPFDMMPLTDAIECVALLQRAPVPATRVLYEDDDLIAVDKPPHLATTPEGDQRSSLLSRVRREHDLPELAAIHRLDAGTSGVCLLAKHKAAVAPFAAALKAGEKQYLALARGITRAKGSVNRPLRDGRSEREARTRYTRLAVLSGHSLLRVRPDQGRTHQIRRHLAALGHPVLGDARYGDAPSNRHFDMRHGLDRPFLHLQRVQLTHPTTGAVLVLEAPLPGDLLAVRDRLQRDSRNA